MTLLRLWGVSSEEEEAVISAEWRSTVITKILVIKKYLVSVLV